MLTCIIEVPAKNMFNLYFDENSQLSVDSFIGQRERSIVKACRCIHMHAIAIFLFYTTPVLDRFVLVHFSFASSLRQEREENRIAQHNLTDAENIEKEEENDAVHPAFRILKLHFIIYDKTTTFYIMLQEIKLFPFIWKGYIYYKENLKIQIQVRKIL